MIVWVQRFLTFPEPTLCHPTRLMHACIGTISPHYFPIDALISKILLYTFSCQKRRKNRVFPPLTRICAESLIFICFSFASKHERPKQRAENCEKLSPCTDANERETEKGEKVVTTHAASSATFQCIRDRVACAENLRTKTTPFSARFFPLFVLRMGETVRMSDGGWVTQRHSPLENDGWWEESFLRACFDDWLGSGSGWWWECVWILCVNLLLLRVQVEGPSAVELCNPM